MIWRSSWRFCALVRNIADSLATLTEDTFFEKLKTDHNWIRKINLLHSFDVGLEIDYRNSSVYILLLSFIFHCNLSGPSYIQWFVRVKGHVT